jgi:ribosomal protein S18 acetylase RimI-like enzyme
MAMGRVTIREVRDDEHAALGQLTVAAYRGVTPQSPEYEAQLVDVAHRAAHAVVLAAVDEDGTLLGGLTLVLPGPNLLAEHAEPDAASIRMLAVDEAARGRGVGEALTVEAIERSRAAGARAMVLHSQTAMTAAHRLYERLGFVRDPSLDWVPEPDVELLGFRLAL